MTIFTLPTPSIYFSTLLPIRICALFLKHSKQKSLSLIQVLLGLGLSWSVIHIPVWFKYKYHSVVEDWHSFTQKQSNSFSSIVSMSLFHAGILNSLNICICLVVSDKHYFLEVIYLLWLLQSLPSHFIYLRIFRDGSDIDIPFKAESSNISYYLYTNYYIFALIARYPYISDENLVMHWPRGF